MEEWEALIKRRQLLWDRVSKMNHEVEKIDQRLDFLEKIAASELYRYPVQERPMQEVI
jgi:hypothetical protein